MQASPERLDLLAQRATLLDDAPPRGREHDAAPLAVEQARAEVALQALHLLRDGGRRVPEVARRGVHGAGALDGEQGVHGGEVDHASDANRKHRY